MKDSRGFLAFWLVNSLIFYFAPFVLNGMVVVGNVRLASFMASVISGFLLTLAVSVTMPIFTSLKIKLTDEWQWALAYLFVNVVALWVIARYADLTGFGISNAWVAIILGVVFNLAQWGTWRLVDPKGSKGKK